MFVLVRFCFCVLFCELLVEEEVVVVVVVVTGRKKGGVGAQNAVRRGGVCVYMCVCVERERERERVREERQTGRHT